MSRLPRFEILLKGEFEDAFLYMGQLFAVRVDRTLVQADLRALVDRAFVDVSKLRLAEMFLLRNDFLVQEGTQLLLSDAEVRAAVEGSALARAIEVDEDGWVETDDFGRVLPEGDVLDLHVYAQRLFVASTAGMIHSDLVENGAGVRLSPSVRRTDAPCLAVGARSGMVVASCGDEGLMLGFDEFDELGSSRRDQFFSSRRSLRTAWLGYHLVNYTSPTFAEGLRSRYEYSSRSSVRSSKSVITDVSEDGGLLAPEREAWAEASFVSNDHRVFFSRYRDGSFEMRSRSWRSGRLGSPESSVRGTVDQPISTHRCHSGFVIETFDSVVLVSADGVETLVSGEAVSVRTFPNSKYYQNIILVVEDDQIRLISPMVSRGAI